MKRFQLRRAHAAFVVLAAVATACSKGDAPRADSAKQLVASSAPVATPGRTRTTMPGALTKPIDDYTADEFLDFVSKLPYAGGHERERHCRNDPGCSGLKPTRHTTVLVDAVRTQDSLSAGTTPQFGVVYARAKNRGDSPEARYGMLPDKNFDYYLIVTADTAGAMVWRMEQYDRKARSHSKFGTGAFVGCNHKWVAGADADFKTCEQAQQDSVKKLGLALQGLTDSPIWTGCSMGCCVVI